MTTFVKPGWRAPRGWRRLAYWKSAYPHPTLLRAVARVEIEPGVAVPANYSPTTHAVWVPGWAEDLVDELGLQIVSDSLARRTWGEHPQTFGNIYDVDLRGVLVTLARMPMRKAERCAAAIPATLALAGSPAVADLYETWASARFPPAGGNSRGVPC